MVCRFYSLLSTQFQYLSLVVGFIALCLCSMSSFADEFVGSGACQACHGDEYKHWRQSHHAAAMQVANEKTVLGDFNNAVFVYGGNNHRFYRKDGKHWVHTDGPDGRMADFEIGFVFGVRPLQQYLVEMPGGRLQALNIAWDSRQLSDGGQRWYHLYPDEALHHDDSLHWTGYYHNWNSRCASCHSTNLQKGYDITTDQFSTTWSEISVGCEACHGPASKHMQWASTSDTDKSTDTGVLSLRDSGQWRFVDGQAIAARDDNERPQKQIDTCASCHSLRSELTPTITAGKPHHQQHTLRLLDEPLYYADGQISDEVYVYGSFLQSKMHDAGVVCSDCHDPHSGNVKGGKETVCLQCHQHETYNTARHHRHKEGSAGSFCVDCHMPVTTYMGVDPRRDHSFRIPRSGLSASADVPNVCNDCHTEKSTEWSMDALSRWQTNVAVNGEHVGDSGDAGSADVRFAEARIALNAGHADAFTLLQEVTTDHRQPEIRRASVLQQLSGFPSSESVSQAHRALRENDPLMRRAAIGALAFVPVTRRSTYLPLLRDDSLSVRLAAVPFLAALPVAQLSDADNALLGDGIREYISIYEQQADVPSMQLNLGNLYLALGALPDAASAFEQALVIAPNFTPALLNLADVYRQMGDAVSAFRYLTLAAERADDKAASAHALGLHYVRAQESKQALVWLQKATDVDPANSRYAYVLAVALNTFDQRAAALSEVQRALLLNPVDPQLLQLQRQLLVL